MSLPHTTTLRYIIASDLGTEGEIKQSHHNRCEGESVCVGRSAFTSSVGKVTPITNELNT